MWMIGWIDYMKALIIIIIIIIIIYNINKSIQFCQKKVSQPCQHHILPTF